MQPLQESEVEVRTADPRETTRALQRAGAIWDRGWFCSVECRDAFNVYAPADGWDRALESLKKKPST